MASYHIYTSTLDTVHEAFITELNAAFTASGIKLRAEYGESAPFLKFYNTKGTEELLVMTGVGSGVNTQAGFDAKIGASDVSFVPSSSYACNGRYFGIAKTASHVAILWGDDAATGVQMFIIFGSNQNGVPVALANTDITANVRFLQDKNPKSVVLDGAQNPYGLTTNSAPLSTIVAGMEFPCTSGISVQKAYWLPFAGNYPIGATTGTINGKTGVLICGYWLLLD